jgi:hypothetical protein
MHRKPQILLKKAEKRTCRQASLSSASRLQAVYPDFSVIDVVMSPVRGQRARAHFAYLASKSLFFFATVRIYTRNPCPFFFGKWGPKKNAFYVPNITEKIGRTSTTAVRKCVHRKYLVSAVHWRKHRLLMTLSKLRYRRSFEYGSRISRAERTPG